ncbi:MAG: hypothetical protein ACQUHE_00165 [Bacteroidia bacterium]
MQPTEHKRKDDIELIAHIKQSLEAHEEFYQLGAWEKFNEKQQQKKRPIFWMTKLSGIAAILAVCFSLIWFVTRSPQGEHIVNTSTKKVQSPDAGSQELSLQEEPTAEQLATLDQVKNVRSTAYLSASSIKQEISSRVAEEEVAVNTSGSNQGSTTPAPVNTTIDLGQVIAQVPEKANSDISDFLASETQKAVTKQDKLAVNRKQKKWDMGFVLAPSFGNTRELNLGYGLTMSYNFSDRLSLSSGIAYNKMNASKNLPTNIGMSPILLGNTKSLEMISEEVTGLDIPLELKYHLNKNVYANLGVSGFAVLSQSRRNTFVEEVVVKGSGNARSSNGGAISNGGVGGAGLEDQKGQFANSYIVSQRTTEKAASSAIEDVNYIGFYNLSFGYTKKVYKNHALSIEPFVKLPIRMVTQDNLRLVGTGVRLKVGF